MKTLLISLILLISIGVNAQEYKELSLNIPSEKDSIYGTLLLPEKCNKPPLVILISGSGPTDRNGNSIMSNNNSLKYLAEGLSKRGIATYRFDKGIISLLEKGKVKEDELIFTQLISDAKKVLTFFKNQYKFKSIFIAGHSQGSLVGMVVAQNKVDGFISLAGAGNPIDVILKEQLTKQVPQLKDSYSKTINTLKSGKKDPDFNPMLASLFRLSIQPFIMDWMRYNPQEELKKLHIPILIINGTKDIQVSEKEAELLHRAKPDSKLVLIQNMNHILKEIKGDITANYASYNNPELPVIPELIDSISNFVKEHSK